MSDTSALYDAISQGEVNAVSRLLSENPKILSGDGTNPPPLHWAIFEDQTPITELLLTSGANINQLDPDRKATPLEYAAVYGRKEAIRMLVAKGADPSEAAAVARKGAAGGFSQFEELPNAQEYQGILEFVNGL